MITGIIKTWDSNKGGGFVTDDDYGDDFFVHISKVRKGQTIRKGSKVKFDTEDGPKGPQAKNITLY